jgi:hypothetical protein
MGIATEEIPGFLFFDHVAVSVKLAMGLKEIHREMSWGKIRCVKYCCAWGDGPNLI